MPFLDILITPKQDGSLSTTVYRKPTHTDLYLQWDSHQTISSKYSVVGILHHRAKTIFSSPQLLQQKEHLHKGLTKCKNPAWALNRVNIKTQAPAQNNNFGNNTKSNENPYMVVHYSKRLSKSLKKACSKHGVQVYFKGGMTIKSFLVAPKDKDPILKKVQSYTGINVTGWSVMKSTLESLQEHLERGSRNTKMFHPQYMTILTPLVIMLL